MAFFHCQQNNSGNFLCFDCQKKLKDLKFCYTVYLWLIGSRALYGPIRSLDKGEETDLIIMDFSKAFDSVPHQRLLMKLRYYGIRGILNTWLTQWLTCRSQTVVVDGYNSPDVPVLSGVPQGTVIGPLLFLLYINDLGENCTSRMRLFADDTLIYSTIES